MDDVGEDRERDLGADRDRDLAAELLDVRADGVGAEQQAGAAVGDELQQATAAARREGAGGVVEPVAGADDVAALGACGVFGETDGGGGGVRVDAARDRTVVRAGVVAEQVRGEQAAVVVRGVGEGRDAGDVAAGPEVVVPDHAATVVDLEGARSQVDAEQLEAEAVEVRDPPGGDEQALGADGRAVVEGGADGLSVALDPGRGRAGADDDALVREGVLELERDLLLLAGEQLRLALDDRDARAEAAGDLRALEADRAAAEHEQRRGQLALVEEEVVAGPDRDVVEALDRRGGEARAGRDDEVAVADLLALDVDHAGRDDAAVRAEQPRSGVADAAGGAAVVVVLGDAVPQRDGGVIGLGGVVEGERRRGRAVVAGLGGAVADLGGVEHRLGGHAGEVRADAADPGGLDERGGAAAAGDVLRDPLAC